MDKIAELKQKLTDASEEMKSMNALCEKEDRGFTDEEQGKYDGLDKSLDSIDEEIKTEEKAAQDRIDRATQAKDRQDKLDAVNDRINNITIPTPIIQVEEPEDFKTIAEFLDSAMKKIFYPSYRDNRLSKWYSITTQDPHFEARAEQSMGEGTAGGYMVPTQFKPELMQIAVQQALIRPRATIIPAGSPPDAEIEIPALNQSSSVTGGVDLAFVKEGGTKNQTDFSLKTVSLIPHELSGYIDVTDKLLRNWPACVSFVETMLKTALMAGEDYVFLNGTGVAQPHGIVNQNAAITVGRNTAGSILYPDIRAMYWRVLRRNGTTPIWVISPTGLDQLLALADPGTAGTLIWQPSAREGAPSTLMGAPCIINERSPALGSAGDLMLLNLAYYLIKDGSGPFVAASPHVHFTSNKTCIKIFWNVDGDSWLQDPFPLEGDTANFLSPFILLGA